MRARLRVPVAIALTVATALAYGGVLRLGFVSDDLSYLVANRRLLDGFTAANLAWAFTSFEQANWHPVTWLSHLLDVRLFGLRPSGHHAANLLLHLLNTLLLFELLRRLTGRLWRSAAVRASSRCTRCASSPWPGWPSARTCSAASSGSSRSGRTPAGARGLGRRDISFSSGHASSR